MKIRSGFVSNSSSSSYLVLRDLSEIGIKCVKLTPSQISYIRERYKKEIDSNGFSFISKEQLDFVNSHDNIWITQFINDCTSTFEKIEDKEIIKESEKSFYFEGDLSESPRDEEYFNCLIDDGYDGGIWIFKEDDKDHKEMSIDEIIKFLKLKKKEGEKIDTISFGNEITIKFVDNEN